MRASTRLALASLLFLAIAGIGSAETCLSPFVKRLDRPEKYLYVFCVDADAKDHDFLAVIDVDAKSPKYGSVIEQLDLGSAGNETHHFGYNDDRTKIFGCSLFSSKIFMIDVATNPAKPKLEKVIELPEKFSFGGPHSPYALPGRMLFSFLSAKDGGLPAGLAEFTNDGKLIREIALPKDSPYMYDVAVKPDINRMVTSSLHADEQLQEADGENGLQELRQGAAALGFPRAQGGARWKRAARRWRHAGRSRKRRTTASPTARSTIPSGSGKGTTPASTRPASCARPASSRPTCASRRTTSTST